MGKLIAETEAIELGLAQKIVDLRVQGKTLPEIATKLKLDQQVVDRYLAMGLLRAGSYFPQEWKLLLLARLEKMHGVFLEQALQGDTKAARTVLDIAATEARLVGIYSGVPKQPGQTQTVIEVVEDHGTTTSFDQEAVEVIPASD